MKRNYNNETTSVSTASGLIFAAGCDNCAEVGPTWGGARNDHQKANGSSRIRNERGSHSGSVSTQAPALSIEVVGNTLVVTYAGVLDAGGALLLREAVEAAFVADIPHRVEIDLRAMTSSTSDGIARLAECAQLGAAVRGGLQYRVGA